MKACKHLLGFWAANLLLLGVLSAAPNPSAQTSGAPAGGLQITVYLDDAQGGRSGPPKFRVEFRNAGENDLILNLGVALANGRKQYPNAVFLILTDAQGRSRRLDLREPGLIAGRVDPLIVPLPVGSTFSLPVDLDKYWPWASREFDYKLRPGNYSLAAQYIGRAVDSRETNLDVKGMALMPYWEGTATSNQLAFAVPRQ